ncbi:Retrotransposon gag protein [Gossypium australe]|uniref:Retrotransposon gag protein n=1 Tax=Gossypium australe TaxID=47621 RepID=A0A5B6USS5_9ROSI|nr:Retrotransposon gag protein [Gossypium australe]
MTLYVFGYFLSLLLMMFLCGQIHILPSKQNNKASYGHNEFLETRRQLYEAWECFKLMLHKCPYHGLQDWLQLQVFYNGLDGNLCSSLDGVSARAFMSKIYDEAC